MEDRFLSILLVEQNLADAHQLAQRLKKYQDSQISLYKVRAVDEAISLLASTNIDTILWSPSADEIQFLAEIEILRKQAPHIPILILTTSTCLNFATKALQSGAQDCLTIQNLTEESLWRAVQYGIIRHQTEFKIRNEALMKQMLDRIRSFIDLETILKTTAQVIQEFSQTDRVLIYRCESKELAETTVIAPSVSAKLDLLAIDQFINTVNFPSLQAILSASAAPQVVEDTFLPHPQDLQIIEPQLVRSYLILPVRLPKSDQESPDNLSLDADSLRENTPTSKDQQQRLWGMVVAYNARQSRRWQDWEIDWLRKLTSQVTIAIQHSQLCGQLKTANQKLHQLAILDGLTGIANRRYFDLVLDKEWQRLAREGQPLSLILCDVDYFKAYNDTYGHQQGDRCLQKISQILQQSTRRPADLVARYGGEEFALILPNTNAPGALFLAHNIVRQLASKNLAHSTSPVSGIVTLSLGITTRIPKPKQPSSTIIEAADSLLYKAKKAGRNQLAVDNWLTSEGKV
ncbi:MAG: diguanylate cyclase [Cyanobacteria bacterium J06600_6]